jgi:hypothetical protein
MKFVAPFAFQNNIEGLAQSRIGSRSRHLRFESITGCCLAGWIYGCDDDHMPFHTRFPSLEQLKLT